MTSRGKLGRVADRVTGRVIDTVSPDLVLEQVDVNAVAERVDVNRLLERIDVDRLLARIDLAELAGRIDVQHELDRVDLNALLDPVDLDRLLDRLDVNRLLERIDVNRALDRVDVGRLLRRVDVPALLERVDVAGLVERADVPALVTASTGRVAETGLHAARRHLLAADHALEVVTGRLMRRRSAPTSEPALVGAAAPVYAGAASRAVAAVCDVLTASWAFALLYGGTGILVDAFTRFDLDNAPPSAAGLAVGCWWVLYSVTGLNLTGRTPGKALAGLRVLPSRGRQLSVVAAVTRTLAFPLSWLLAGLGLLGIVFDRHRRALHDVVAGTVVVHDWQQAGALPTATRTRPGARSPAHH